MSKNLLYFRADWCSQCRQVTPIIDKLTLEGLPIRKIDVGLEPAMGDKYFVQSLPNFIVEEDGRVVQQLTGPQSEATIRGLLNGQD